MAIKKDPFKVLGINRTRCSESELKQVYLDLIRKYTPEKRPDKFEEVRSAYNTLKNARSPYDLLATAPLEMTDTHSSRNELREKLERDLGIREQKITLKKAILLKKLEEIINDTGN